jgi:hypothetical protein
MQARHAVEVEENKRQIEQGYPPIKYLYEIPEPGERFEYVYVKHGGAFDIRGYRSRPKKGDVMEFPHVAKAHAMEIDTALYMESYVVGLCARFINGDADFEPDPTMKARMEPKQIDKKAQDKAKKFLENFIKRCGNEDPKVNRARGYAYRRAYQNAAAIADEELTSRVGADAEILSGDWLSFHDFTEEEEEIEPGEEGGAGLAPMDSTSRRVERLVTRARDLAVRVCDSETEAELGRMITGRLGIKPDGSDKENDKSSRRLFAVASSWCSTTARRAGARPAPSFHARVLSALDRKEARLRREIVELLPAITDIAMKYEIDLERLVGQCRAAEHCQAHEKLGVYTDDQPGAPEKLGVYTDDRPADSAQQNWKPSLTLVPADGKSLAQMRGVWLSMVGVFIMRERDRRIQHYLSSLKNKRLGIVVPPTKADVKKIVAAAAKKVAAIETLPQTHW